jgi:RNA polymerase sigma-70 factor (ECF subfamily)
VLANAERADRRRSRLTRRLTAQPAPVPAAPPSAGGEAAAIARALAALSPSDRELLLLAGWEGLTPAQIAQLLDRPAPLISRRLHRARRRFAAALTAAGGQAAGRGNPILMEAE